ncbi:hypothetical protein FSW04_17645 [Baekduia soli]|uniref:DUF2384 domain-containing protein n=1 Tax=Baekduia soli TaxID=496014 RepID=A0A5B8U9B1_9ACTN|nr:hypothetical protein [Baekduia soli]QEC49222.1 hypothetical protein FSW04_17645 [Baekduia soli]
MTPELLSESIESEARAGSPETLVGVLVRQFGDQLCVYLCGLTDTVLLSAWMSGTDQPNSIQELRIRTAYTAARMIAGAYDEATAESWLFGSHPAMGDEAPAWVVRHARSAEDLRQVVPAAKAFARSSE